MDYFLRGKWIMWLYLLFFLILLFSFFYLTIMTILSRIRLRRFIARRDEVSIKEIELQKLSQKSLFHSWLLVIKLSGIILAFIFIQNVVVSFIQAFDAMAKAGVFEMTLVATGISEVLIGWVFGLFVGVSCWIVYFIFSSISEKRVMTLERIRIEKSPE